MATILAAGEDYSALAIAAATIEGEGHRVITADNGLDAYQMVLSEKPDLAILEVTMPIFNGFETCTMILDDPEVPKDFPVILLTVEPIDSRKMEQVGAADQLPKVHSSIELRDMLVRYLGDKAAV